jgi:putative addiction module CopG family antidote
VRNTQQFSITLPREMAKQVEERVASGAYASVSEVMREGVRALLDRDIAVEKWLRDEVVQSFDEYEANPSSGVPAELVLARVRSGFSKNRKKPTGK